MNKSKKKVQLRARRRARINIKGTADRPRLAVFRSLSHIYAQIIDDNKGITIVSARDKELSEKDLKGMKKVEVARAVGELLAKKAADKKVNTVVFDKGGFKYTGRVKSLADGARDAGLQF